RASIWHRSPTNDIQPQNDSFARRIPASTDGKLISAGSSLGRNKQHYSVQPHSEPLSYQFENGTPIFKNRFYPSEAPHLRKVNSPKTKTYDKNVDTITEQLVIERIHRLFDGLRTVRVSPANSYLVMSLV